MDRDTMCLTFATALLDCFKDEDKRDLQSMAKISLGNDGEDFTDQFTEMVRALYVVYLQIAGSEESDILGFTHLMNRLVVDRLMEYKIQEVLSGLEGESDERASV